MPRKKRNTSNASASPKRRSVRKAASSAAVSQPASEQKHPADVAIKLSQVDLLRYRALEAECSQADIELKYKVKEIEDYITKLPDLRKLIEERGGLTIRLSKKKGELHRLHAEIETTYGVKIADVGIDDETGTMHVLPKQVEVPPDVEPTVVQVPRNGVSAPS